MSSLFAGMTAQEILAKEEEKSGGEDEEEEESSEEETDSEEEEGARLKPVFVRAKDRLTIQEREREELKAKQAERELAKMAEERRRQTLRMVEAEVGAIHKKEKTNVFPNLSGEERLGGPSQGWGDGYS